MRDMDSEGSGLLTELPWSAGTNAGIPVEQMDIPVLERSQQPRPLKQLEAGSIW